jgi:hypothetical protein
MKIYIRNRVRDIYEIEFSKIVRYALINKNEFHKPDGQHSINFSFKSFPVDDRGTVIFTLVASLFANTNFISTVSELFIIIKNLDYINSQLCFELIEIILWILKISFKFTNLKVIDLK